MTSARIFAFWGRLIFSFKKVHLLGTHRWTRPPIKPYAQPTQLFHWWQLLISSSFSFSPGGSPGHKANHGKLGDANSGGFEHRRLDRNASSGQSCGKTRQKSLGVGPSLTMISKANDTFLDPQNVDFEEFMHLDRASSRSSSSPSKRNAPWNHPFSKDHCDAFNPCEKSAAQVKWIQLFISWNLQAKCWKIQPQNHDGKPSFQAVMVLSKQWWCFLVWRSFWCLCCVRIFVPIVWKKGNATVMRDVLEVTFFGGWWRVLWVDGTPNLVGRLRQFCSVF